MSGPGAIREIELKLRFPVSAARVLAAHPLLRNARPRRRNLHTVYYDTPDLELRASGVALRLRREGTRWVQTLKGEGGAAGGLHRRVEIEHATNGRTLDWNMLAAGPYAGLFSSPSLRTRLRPVFATRFMRSERRLETGPGVVIRAAMDRGVIEGGRRREPLCELELELESGEPKVLYDFAQRLAQTLPLALENRTKAERGYALAAGRNARPVKSQGVTLNRGMTIADAFRTIALAALDHLQANAAGLLTSEDPEYTHQMRVALRRMRSAARVFAPVVPADDLDPFLEEMRWLAGALGPARDWDVFVGESLPRFHRKMRGRAARASLEKAAESKRLKARRAARQAVASRRYRLFTLSLAAWVAADKWASATLSRPLLPFAEATLQRRYAKVRKRGRRLASRSPAELHRLRIAIKSLRYAADFFRTLYDEEQTRRILRHLSRLQDILGAMNDASQAEQMLSECCARMRQTVREAARHALSEWKKPGAPALRRKLARAWLDWREQEKFW